ncbi:MAG: hypothetical protein HETSPECPRED_007990 [Heterodermia speciosa]|uniref:Uncharacterized protein n=1 Tax=Heterodermia speciosa TaxID=116794 RepID=A0A8H3ESI2_9LECA|nr:MAG: hypothetical protein HETSPECPRED_007990 [Heterodermia speciosa]
MPFPYESSKEPVRTRRTKDKDGRSTTSTGSSKKSKHPSGSSSRSASQPDRGAQLSLYTQQNLTLDQLPALPESGAESPGSATSPILRASSVVSQASNVSSSSHQLHTPAALRQYLDTEDVETPRLEAAPPPPAEFHPNLQDRPALSGKPLDSHDATPQAGTAQGYLPPARDSSASPTLFGQPLELHRSYSSRTSSSRRNETPSYSASSPPPQSASPSVKSYPGPGSPTPGQHQFHSQSAYVASPPAFAPGIPFQSGAQDESYYHSPYVGPQYLPMTHPSGQVDLQTLPPQTFPSYPNFPPSHPSQGYFNHLQYQSVRGSGSPRSRMTVPGEFPMAQAQGPPPLDSPGPARSATEDDPADLLQRIQGAIPDLQSLLHHYKETSGQLSDKETKLQAAEAQKSETIRNRETQINQLSKELDEVKNKHQAECSKLRLELGNVEEKHKELQETLVLEQKSKEEVQTSLQTSATSNKEMQQKWENEKATWEQEFAAKEKKLLDEYTAKHKELEENSSHQSRDTEASWQAKLDEKDKLRDQEIEALQASSLRRKKSLEVRHNMTVQNLHEKLAQNKKAREESRTRHAESWIKDRETLELKHNQERIMLEQRFEEKRQGFEEQLKKLGEQHRIEIEQIKAEHESLLARQRKEADHEKTELYESIKRLKTQFAEKLHERVASIHEENRKLQKLADAFGEVTDLRSRGDPF